MDRCAKLRDLIYFDSVLQLPQPCSQFCSDFDFDSYRDDCEHFCPDLYRCLVSQSVIVSTTSLQKLVETESSSIDPIVIGLATGISILLVILSLVLTNWLRRNIWCNYKCKMCHESLYKYPVPTEGMYEESYELAQLSAQGPWPHVPSKKLRMHGAPPRPPSPIYENLVDLPRALTDQESIMPLSAAPVSIGTQCSADDFEDTPLKALESSHHEREPHPSSQIATANSETNVFRPSMSRQHSNVQAEYPDMNASYLGSVCSLDDGVPIPEYQQPMENSELKLEDIALAAEEEMSIVIIIFCNTCIEVFYESPQDLSQAHAHFMRYFHLENPDSLHVKKLSSWQYDPHANTLSVGHALCTLTSLQFSAGAFLEIDGQPHVLSATHGQLQEGETVFIHKPKMRLGTCRISSFETNSDFCDASLVSMDDVPHMDAFNRVRSQRSVPLQLALFKTDNPKVLLNYPCHIFKDEGDAQTGVVQSLHVFHFDRARRVKISNCIAVTSNDQFSVPGDSGKMVGVKLSANEISAFGSIAGQIHVQAVDENGTFDCVYTLVTPMPRILNTFMRHPYCRGKRIRVLPPLLNQSVYSIDSNHSYSAATNLPSTSRLSGMSVGTYDLKSLAPSSQGITEEDLEGTPFGQSESAENTTHMDIPAPFHFHAPEELPTIEIEDCDLREDPRETTPTDIEIERLQEALSLMTNEYNAQDEGLAHTELGDELRLSGTSSEHSNQQGSVLQSIPDDLRLSAEAPPSEQAALLPALPTLSNSEILLVSGSSDSNTSLMQSEEIACSMNESVRSGYRPDDSSAPLLSLSEK